jgi:hypothetical protein
LDQTQRSIEISAGVAVHRPSHQGGFLIRVGGAQCQHYGVELFRVHNAFNPDLFNEFGLAYGTQVRLSTVEGSEPPYAPGGERTMGIVPDPAGACVSHCRQDGVGMTLRYIGNECVQWRHGPIIPVAVFVMPASQVRNVLLILG